MYHNRFHLHELFFFYFEIIFGFVQCKLTRKSCLTKFVFGFPVTSLFPASVIAFFSSCLSFFSSWWTFLSFFSARIPALIRFPNPIPPPNKCLDFPILECLLSSPVSSSSAVPALSSLPGASFFSGRASSKKAEIKSKH